MDRVIPSFCLRVAEVSITGVDYGYDDARAVSFSTANLKITYPQGIEVITQGRVGKTDTLDTQITRQWIVENPVPVLSLNAGEYRVYRATIHDVECALYAHPSHLRPVRFFEGAEEDILSALEQIMDAMEQESGMKYTYSSLSLVEIPFHVQWYYEGWEEKGGLTLPGVLMIEEDVFMRQQFTRDFKRYQERSRGNREPKDIKKDLLVRAVFSTFFSREGNSGRQGQPGGLFRSPVVQLWAYDKQFVGEHHSLLKKGMPMYLQNDLSTDMTSAFYSSQRRGGGGDRGRGGRDGPATWWTRRAQQDNWWWGCLGYVGCKNATQVICRFKSRKASWPLSPGSRRQGTRTFSNDGIFFG